MKHASVPSVAYQRWELSQILLVLSWMSDHIQLPEVLEGYIRVQE